MKIGITVATVLTLLLAAQVAYADGECDKYTTSYDQTYCFAKLFLESDKELNASYKELKDSLKDDTKAGLTQTQRDWIKYRDATCSNKGTIDVDCNYRVNRDRTNYLRDRARECKTGTCRNDMITQKSW